MAGRELHSEERNRGRGDKGNLGRRQPVLRGRKAEAGSDRVNERWSIKRKDTVEAAGGVYES